MSSIPPVESDGASGRECGRLIANTVSASLTVAGIHESLAWYRDVMGFAVARSFERGGVLEDEPRDMIGVRMFRLRDPDRFKLVVSSEPSSGPTHRTAASGGRCACT
ncbi:MAG: hypothetical protein ABI119_03550 [Gemmatimonadaceae bacterium]